jgi:hypothetical protein
MFNQIICRIGSFKKSVVVVKKSDMLAIINYLVTINDLERGNIVKKISNQLNVNTNNKVGRAPYNDYQI